MSCILRRGSALQCFHWVCVCVCLSVTLHLTSRMFVRLTNDATYLTGNEGQKFRTVFSLLERFHHCTILSLRKTRVRIIFERGGKRPFCFSWFSSSVSCYFTIMPPSHTFKDTTNQTIMVVYTTTLNAPNQLASKRQSITMDKCMCKFV